MLNPLQKNFIRTLYVLVILILAGFAVHTWRQLQSLRTAPVALPNFWFYVVGQPGRMVVQAHGSWLVVEGPALRDHLQTSTIECHQERMQCMESTAVVTTQGGTFLESIPRVYAVESWNDREIVSKPQIGECAHHAITLNLAERFVTAATTLRPDKTECKDPPRKLKLENGSKARDQGIKK